MNNRTASLATASTLLAVGLLLTGCAAIPIPGVDDLGDQAGQEAIEDAIEDATGTRVDVGDSVEVPAGWPGLPLPDAPLIAAIAGDGIFSLTYQLDGDAPILALQDALLADGYEVTGESSGGIFLWAAADAEWTVAFTWYESDGGNVEFLYGATPTGS